ncbi:MAG TPA: VanZ family protein [Blastocatellia bacterium]|nr:VanZ family protein [Blastocatellia bacterium]
MAENITTAESSVASRIIRYWLPVAIALGGMYYFSTDIFSGDNTRSFIRDLLERFMPGVSSATVLKVNYVVRKCAHFVEYAALAALLYRAWRADSLINWRPRWAIYSFAMVVVWALIDEYHQTFTRSRGGSVFDVMIDTAGGLSALVLIALYTNSRRPSKGGST